MLTPTETIVSDEQGLLGLPVVPAVEEIFPSVGLDGEAPATRPLNSYRKLFNSCLDGHHEQCPIDIAQSDFSCSCTCHVAATCTNPHPLWRDQPGCHCAGCMPSLHWAELERRAIDR